MENEKTINLLGSHQVNMDDFIIIPPRIGEGAFAEVFLVEKKDERGKYYALKI